MDTMDWEFINMFHAGRGTKKEKGERNTTYIRKMELSQKISADFC